MDDPTYAQLFKSLPKKQQQKFSHLPPTAMAEYFFILQNNEKEGEKKRRRKGGEERKCNNPSCDKIVNRRNYCYKCQKKKERGIPFSPPAPKLPSLKQLLPTILQKDDRTSTEMASNLPSISCIMNSPTLNTQTSQENKQTKCKILPKVTSATQSSPQFPTFVPNSQEASPSFPAMEVQNNLVSDQSMEKLHAFIVSLAGGSEEKASSLLQQYCNSFYSKQQQQNTPQFPAFCAQPNSPFAVSQNHPSMNHSPFPQSIPNTSPFVQSPPFPFSQPSLSAPSFNPLPSFQLPNLNSVNNGMNNGVNNGINNGMNSINSLLNPSNESRSSQSDPFVHSNFSRFKFL